MVRRMLETGVSVYSGSWAEGPADVVEEAAVDAAGALYFSTSSRIILPSGPEPLSLLRGIPRSRAIFLAMGDAKMRSPEASSGLDSVLGLDSVGCALDSCLGTSGAFSSLGASFAGSEAFSEANLSAVDRSSPSSARTAMSEPT